MSPDHAQPGNGLLLFFRVDDFDMALPRARALVARLEEEPHVNLNTGTTEFSLRDPDGYTSQSAHSLRPDMAFGVDASASVASQAGQLACSVNAAVDPPTYCARIRE